MAEKRYALVRVDDKCPEEFEDKEQCLNTWCGECRFANNYGDTKEQLIRKVAQVLYREELEWYKTHLKFVPGSEIDEPFFRNIYENCLAKAKKIIEFLGIV